MSGGRIGYWRLLLEILRRQFTHPPYPPIKKKGRHRK